MWSCLLIVPWLPPVAEGDFVTPKLVLQSQSVPKIPLAQGTVLVRALGVGLVCV